MSMDNPFFQRSSRGQQPPPGFTPRFTNPQLLMAPPLIPWTTQRPQIPFAAMDPVFGPPPGLPVSFSGGQSLPIICPNSYRPLHPQILNALNDLLWERDLSHNRFLAWHQNTADFHNHFYQQQHPEAPQMIDNGEGSRLVATNEEPIDGTVEQYQQEEIPDQVVVPEEPVVISSSSAPVPISSNTTQVFSGNNNIEPEFNAQRTELVPANLKPIIKYTRRQLLDLQDSIHATNPPPLPEALLKSKRRISESASSPHQITPSPRTSPSSPYVKKLSYSEIASTPPASPPQRKVAVEVSNVDRRVPDAFIPLGSSNRNFQLTNTSTSYNNSWNNVQPSTSNPNSTNILGPRGRGLTARYGSKMNVDYWKTQLNMSPGPAFPPKKKIEIAPRFLKLRENSQRKSGVEPREESKNDKDLCPLSPPKLEVVKLEEKVEEVKKVEEEGKEKENVRMGQMMQMQVLKRMKEEKDEVYQLHLSKNDEDLCPLPPHLPKLEVVKLEEKVEEEEKDKENVSMGQLMQKQVLKRMKEEKEAITSKETRKVSLLETLCKNYCAPIPPTPFISLTECSESSDEEGIGATKPPNHDRPLMKLHVCTSIKELNSIVDEDITKNIRNLDKLKASMMTQLENAEDYDTLGDEEKAYICYMRYINVLNSYRCHSEAALNKESKMEMNKALKKCQELLESLKTRYAKLQLENKPRNELKPEETEAKDNGGSASASFTYHMELPINPIQNRSSSPTSSVSTRNPGLMELKYITFEEFEDKLETSPDKLLVIDVRNSFQFKNGHLKAKNCISIPREILYKGITSSSIAKILEGGKDLDQERVELWKNRALNDFIILVDDKDDTEHLRWIFKAMTVKDVKYGGILKSKVKVLWGGYSWEIQFN